MQPTLKDKEWFCCKNVCEILQFKDSMAYLQKQNKRTNQI